MFCPHRFSSRKHVHHSVFEMKQFTQNKLHHFTQPTTHNFLETKARGKERERTLPSIFGDYNNIIELQNTYSKRCLLFLLMFEERERTTTNKQHDDVQQQRRNDFSQG